MKKAEKPAASSRAKSDKGTSKSKAAAPAKAKAKKADGKAAKAEEKADAKGKKAPAKAEAKVDTKAKGKADAKGKKPEAKTDAKASAKSDGKGKGRGKAAPPAPSEELAEAAAVVVEAQEAVAAAEDSEDTQPIPAIPDAPPAELSEEERELSSLYQGELESPSLAHGEFKDQKTADEDRPMLPEINARDERRRGWEDRRERRRQEREQRRLARRDSHRGQQGGGNGQRPPQHQQGQGGQQQSQPQSFGNRNERGDRPQGGFDRDRGERNDRDRGERNDRNDRGDRDRSFQDRNASGGSASQASGGQLALPAVSASPSASGAAAVDAAVGTPMAAATANLFAQLRNGQPLPVKQLAAMLRKRGLIEGEPDLIWPQLRAELIADERAFRSLGLRPRVVHRGRDLFAPGPSFSSEESQLVAAVTSIQAATARNLAGWIAQASPAAFERLIHSYLAAVGYRDVNWVKRVDGIAYAQATAPGIERSVLVSARSGSGAIDRRGIGELRVGVEAKNLPFGYLFAAGSLSPEAERELERAGRSIVVVCGDALVSALMSAGIGVASTAVSVRLLDEQFLDELNAG